jgi:nucleotide-binding universal stress UspA family protein
MNMIVAAVDFSDVTPAVVAAAVSFAKTFGADLQLFHAIEPAAGYVTYDFNTVEYPGLDELREEARWQAASRMKELLTNVRAELPQSTSQIVCGNAPRELLQHLKRTHADLVVIGSHGHGPVSSILLGSVADAIVRSAAIPTLIVPATRPNPTSNPKNS